MAIVNPFRKVRCPYCSEEYYPGNCAIVSSVNQGTVLQPARTDFLARAFVAPLKGNRYTKELARRQCPYCGKLLPHNDEIVETYTIAIVGDSTSGKSHYIASCINQLKQPEFLQMIGCRRILGQGDTDVRYYNNYYNPLYNLKQRIPLTSQASIPILDPLIYQLVFLKKSALHSPKAVNLLFYDSSGEDIIRQKEMVLYSHYILSASAIIFLADPMAMPRIVDVLPQHLKPQARRTFSTSDVFNRVIQTFEQNQGINPGERLRIPVAITISKSDLLKFVSHAFTKQYGRPPLFLEDSNYSNRLDTLNFERINDELQVLLQMVGDKVLLYSKDLFENACLFAVSATGWPSDDQDHFPAIEPLRCLDPLLWSLWKLGIVDLS